MKWTFSELHKYQTTGLKLNEVLDCSAIVDRDAQLLNITPVKVCGTVEIDSKNAIFQLQISGSFTLPCARSLVSVDCPFDIDTSEVFAFDKSHANGDVIDLYSVICEILLVNIPFQVYADEKSQLQGVPKSGQGWELVSKEKLEGQIDPRLRKLEQFLIDNEVQEVEGNGGSSKKNIKNAKKNEKNTL